MRQNRVGAKKKQEARIARLYSKHCHGLRINVMDIGKVYEQANAWMQDRPDLSDDQLGGLIRDYVETIARD